MTGDEIRQKAREYRKQWSHKPTAIPPDATGLWYSEECTDDLMTAFAESLLSGGAAVDSSEEYAAALRAASEGQPAPHEPDCDCEVCFYEARMSGKPDPRGGRK